jgi:hypothetical protein
MQRDLIIRGTIDKIEHCAWQSRARESPQVLNSAGLRYVHDGLAAGVGVMLTWPFRSLR